MEKENNNAVQTAQKKDAVITYMAGGVEIKLTKQTVVQYLVNGQADKVSDQEIMMYIGLCKANQLNPFAKECFLIKYGTAPAQMVIASEALSKRAERSGHLKGIKYGVILKRSNDIVYQSGTFSLPTDELVGGWATILRDDMEPYETSISLAEFRKDQATWKTMPNVMIAKCAKSKALREAFPDIAQGMISEEEKNTDPNYQPFASGNRAERIQQLSHQPQPVKVETIPTEATEVQDVNDGLFSASVAEVNEEGK